MNEKELKALGGASLEVILQSLEKAVLERPELLYEEERNQVDRYISELAEGELFTAVMIVRVLLENFLETGEMEYFGRGWFCERFPWKRSKMTEKLQLLVTEGILLYSKRQYSLNVKAPFVQRIQRTMRLEQYDIDFEALLEKFSQEIVLRRGRKEVEKQVVEQQPEQKKKQIYRITTRKEQKQFIKELRTTYFDNLEYLTAEELEEELERMIEQQILQTIGIIEKEDA